jgi:hypothetical protein
VIPKELLPFFWEVDADNFDPRKYADYAIGRILELGTETAISWMRGTFTEEEIKKVIREDRKLSPKSATFWAFVYGIPVAEVAALAARPAPL